MIVLGKSMIPYYCILYALCFLLILLRNCIGQRFAMIVLKVTVAHIVSK